MRNMLEMEVNALKGLREGRLDGLIELLAEGRGRLHVVVQRELLAMLTQHPSADYCLSIKLRPGLHHKKTRRAKQASFSVGQRVAGRIEDLRTDQGIKRERATEIAAQEFGMKYDNADRLYERYGKLIRFFRAHAKLAQEGIQST